MPEEQVSTTTETTVRPGDPAPVAAPAAAPAAAPNAAAELAQARETIKATTESARKAMRTANPDLPDSAFDGDDVNTIETNIARARTIATHAVKAYTDAHPLPQPATTPTDAGAARTPVTAPANLSPTAKIQWALRNPGPGSTE